MHSQHSKQRASATRPHSRISIAVCASCALLLQACGATLQASPSASLELPSPPSLSTPQPAQPYSKSWQTEVDAWQSAVQKSREQLMAMPLTSR
ncbi:hypothetical protein SAMN05444579_11357 [Delftia tsuruhatensis]|nr:hypothetical protein SAMN05444579_11357 [Delftia tsuruhatensis]